MLRPFRQHQRKTARLHRSDHVCADHLIPARSLGQCFVNTLKFSPRIRCRDVRGTEACWTHEHVVREGPETRLPSGIHTVAHRSALHEHNRMMAVLASDGSGEPCDIARFGPAGDEFKTSGWQMMALIYD